MVAMWGTALLAPLPDDAAFSEGSTEPEFVLRLARHPAIGEVYALWCSEVGQAGWQAVSLRAARGNVAPDLRSEALPTHTHKAYGPLLDEFGNNSVVFESPDGRTHVYGSLLLAPGAVALVEVHQAVSDAAAALASARRLAGRVQQAWRDSPYAALTGFGRGSRYWLWQYAAVPVWLGAGLEVAGTIGIATSAHLVFKILFVLGYLLALVGVLVPLVRAWRAIPAAHADRASALWRSPWALARHVAAVRFPLAVALAAALLVQPGWYTWPAVALLFLSWLGQRVLTRPWPGRGLPDRSGPLCGPGPWKELRAHELPPGFPVLPRAPLAVLRHSESGAHAAVLPGTYEPVAEWSRWQQRQARWESPRGPVTAEAYQLWDGRPETAVHARVGELSIVVESTANSDLALQRTRQLTEALRTHPAAAQRRLPPVTFEKFPAMFGAAVVGLVFLYGSFDALGVVSSSGLLRLLWFTGVALPAYAVVLNTAVAVYPPLAGRDPRIWGLVLVLSLPVLGAALLLWAAYTPYTSAPVRWSLGLLAAAVVTALVASGRAAWSRRRHGDTMVR